MNLSLIGGHDRTTLKFMLEQDIPEETKVAIRAELQRRTSSQRIATVDSLISGSDTWTIGDCVEQLESCDYECEAGLLKNNVAYRRMLAIHDEQAARIAALEAQLAAAEAKHEETIQRTTRQLGVLADTKQQLEWQLAAAEKREWERVYQQRIYSYAYADAMRWCGQHDKADEYAKSQANAALAAAQPKEGK